METPGTGRPVWLSSTTPVIVPVLDCARSCPVARLAQRISAATLLRNIHRHLIGIHAVHKNLNGKPAGEKRKGGNAAVDLPERGKGWRQAAELHRTLHTADQNLRCYGCGDCRA